MLTGGIVSFARLGKGLSGKVGAIFMACGLSIGLVAMGITLIIAFQVDETIFTKREHIVSFYVLTAIFTHLLPVISVPLAFMAKPGSARIAEVQDGQPSGH